MTITFDYSIYPKESCCIIEKEGNESNILFTLTTNLLPFSSFNDSSTIQLSFNFFLVGRVRIHNTRSRVELKPLGKIGYVANSVKTVIGECYSAGRLYDKIGDKAKAEICFVTPSGVIAKVKNSLKKKDE